MIQRTSLPRPQTWQSSGGTTEAQDHGSSLLAASFLARRIARPEAAFELRVRPIRLVAEEWEIESQLRRRYTPEQCSSLEWHLDRYRDLNSRLAQADLDEAIIETSRWRSRDVATNVLEHFLYDEALVMHRLVSHFLGTRTLLRGHSRRLSLSAELRVTFSPENCPKSGAISSRRISDFRYGSGRGHYSQLSRKCSHKPGRIQVAPALARHGSGAATVMKGAAADSVSRDAS